MVTKTKIKVFAIPTAHASSTQGLVSGKTYAPECMVALNIDRSQVPFGSTVQEISDFASNGGLARAFNTQIRFTRSDIGAKATGCVLEATYYPKKLYQFTDLFDHIDDYKFATTGDVAADNECTNKAYFNIFITPTRAGAPATDGSGVVPGVALPHRVSIEVENTIVFYNEEINLNPNTNVPLGGGGGDAAGETFADIGRGFGNMMAGAARAADAFDDAYQRGNKRRHLDL